MKVQSVGSHTKKGILYFLLPIAGVLIILLCSLVQHVPPPMKGEYYYSSFFRSNFTLLAKAIFFIIGLAVGYVYRLNPWYAGTCLILVFPLTSIMEAIVYPGSHNLIPIEFAYHLWLALPFVLAVYLGKLIAAQVAKRKQIMDENIVS